MSLRIPHPVVTSLTVGIVGVLSKSFLRLGCSERSTTGVEHLYNAWREENRVGKGIVTVSNHISVLDDPLMWGMLPTGSYFSNRNSRWTLGAQDIMFTNPLYSLFFSSGKVIETVRGAGIYQDAIKLSIDCLNKGEWLHVFPQGGTRQEALYPPSGRLKWGIGKILAETNEIPTVIPIWINGFEDVMPEDRGFPRFLPRLGAKISVTFGDPTGLTSKLKQTRDRWANMYGPIVHDAKTNSPLHIDLTACIEDGLDTLGNTLVN